MIDQPGLQESQLSEWERLAAEEIQGAGSVVHYWNGAKVQVLLAEIRFLQTFSVVLEYRAERAEAERDDVLSRATDMLTAEIARSAAISRDLEAAREKANRLEEWSEQQGHPGYCEDRQVDGGDCICGLAAALAPAAEVPA